MWRCEKKKTWQLTHSGNRGRRNTTNKMGGEGEMRVNREALGLVISKIFSAGCEKDTEQVLTDTTTDPVKTHINRLRHFGGDSGVGKADSTFIVSVYSSRRLGVAGARKDGAEVAGYLAVAKHRSTFGLGDIRDKDRNEGAKAVDGGVCDVGQGS